MEHWTIWVNFNAAFTISKNDYLQLFLKYLDTFSMFQIPSVLYQLVSLRQVFLRFNKLTRIEEDIGNLNVCFTFIFEISYLALLDFF